MLVSAADPYLPTFLPFSANIEIGLCVQKCNALLQSPRQSASSHLNVSLGNADRNVGRKVEQQHWPDLPPKDIGVQVLELVVNVVVVVTEEANGNRKEKNKINLKMEMANQVYLRPFVHIHTIPDLKRAYQSFSIRSAPVFDNKIWQQASVLRSNIGQ